MLKQIYFIIQLIFYQKFVSSFWRLACTNKQTNENRLLNFSNVLQEVALIFTYNIKSTDLAY